MHLVKGGKGGKIFTLSAYTILTGSEWELSALKRPVPPPDSTKNASQPPQASSPQFGGAAPRGSPLVAPAAPSGLPVAPAAAASSGGAGVIAPPINQLDMGGFVLGNAGQPFAEMKNSHIRYDTKIPNHELTKFLTVWGMSVFNLQLTG